MTNKLILDGVEYTLSDELANKLMAEVTEQKAQRDLKSAFEREEYDTYYFITLSGRVSRDTDDKFRTDDDRYNVANYCRDKELMEQRALHETLNRLLWRYSEMNGGGEKRGGYFIYRSNMEDMRVGHCTYATGGDVYFRKKEVAEAAIVDVVMPFISAHPEFVW